MSNRFVQHVVVAALVAAFGPGAAQADAQDDAIKAQCPAAAAWRAKQQRSHPEQSEQAKASADAASKPTRPAMRAELFRRMAQDQQARDAMTAAGGKPTRKQVEAAMSVDGDNLAWLKPKVLAHGFPTVAEVGFEGVNAAWLLIQHADRDPGFQGRVLTQIKPRVARGDFSGKHYAMLTDRVRRQAEDPQVYGSQMTPDPAKLGVFKLQPTEDMAHLDQRRASVGMMPMADYECVIKAVYGGTS